MSQGLESQFPSPAHTPSLSLGRPRVTTADLNDNDAWLSPSIVSLANRVMTRMAEISSSDTGVTKFGLKTTGLHCDSEEDLEVPEMPDLEGGDCCTSGLRERASLLEAQADVVLESLASALMLPSVSNGTHTYDSYSLAVAQGNTVDREDCVYEEKGYDTDDDGLQSEMKNLTSIAMQLRDDLEVAKLDTLQLLNDADVQEMSKHLKSWGLLRPGDVLDTDSLLVTILFVLVIIWFVTHHGIAEFQKLLV